MPSEKNNKVEPSSEIYFQCIEEEPLDLTTKEEAISEMSFQSIVEEPLDLTISSQTESHDISTHGPSVHLISNSPAQILPAAPKSALAAPVLIRRTSTSVLAASGSSSAAPALANAAAIVAKGCPRAYVEAIKVLYASNNIPSPN